MLADVVNNGIDFNLSFTFSLHFSLVLPFPSTQTPAKNN
ncbi:hypothetical protein B6N60_01264 [Richelia sinica FACHB-800]|uniref:Uncharacterized protein n=1 Tax=Richelia sinica FACHB-800 TaxID=1357546 RepID=A0A975T5F9_9NOST|nr:hypothetical protein B6N60_01264 [Richelia sinica FACHB-800]